MSSASPRRWLLIGVGVVLVAIVASWRHLAPDPRARTPDTSVTATPATEIAITTESSGRGATDPLPAIETTVDRARIRDHRTGDRGDYQPRPREPGASATRLPPRVVNEISRKLQAVMGACASAVPSGTRPKVEGTVMVDVVGDVLQVTEAKVTIRDHATAARCLEQKWIGQTTAAEGIAETRQYSISVVFAMPSG